MSNITALKTYLAPFHTFFAMGNVTEICINSPYVVWVEQNGNFSRHDMPMLSLDYLMQFAILVAEYNQREITPECPSLSSVLPDGSRVQFVIEPACEKGSFVCAIRRKSISEISLETYFNPLKQYQSANSNQEDVLIDHYKKGNYIEFLKLGILLKKNIIISGGTSTGKTTFLNSLLKFVPLQERIITLETDREVQSHHPNSVHLLASEDGKGRADMTMVGLLKAALRLRPDRILISELRGEEAFAFLRAVNSGHPGSITTLHANCPEGAFEQLAFMSMQNNNFNRQEILTFAKSVIDIIVQISRDNASNRFISEIYFNAVQPGFNKIAKTKTEKFAIG